MIYTNFREIDKAGRIVISKDIRRHLNINAGDVLQINADNECITIRKAEENVSFATHTKISLPLRANTSVPTALRSSDSSLSAAVIHQYIWKPVKL